MNLAKEDALQRALVDDCLPLREAASTVGVSLSAAYRYANKMMLPTNKQLTPATVRRIKDALGSAPDAVVAAMFRQSIVRVRRIKEEMHG